MPQSNSSGFGHGRYGHGPHGAGPWVTYPYTPGYVHGEEMTYAVQPLRFEDLSEQRYLRSRDRGMTLTYEYTHVASQFAVQVAGFYQQMVGPTYRFVARDHRSGLDYVVRFADNTLTQLRGPGMIRHIPPFRLKATRYVTYGEVIAADSPHAWWRLDEADVPGTLVTTAWDAAGLSCRHAVNFFATTFGHSGGLVGDRSTAARFDGNLSHLDVYHQMSVADAFTIEALIRRASATVPASERVVFMTHGTAGSAERSLRIGSSGIVRAIGNTQQVAVSTVALADTTWHYVAWTKAGATNTLYADGVDVTAGTSNTTLTAVGSARIGMMGSAPLLTWNGDLKDVVVYSGAITAADVHQRYLAMTRP